jgi:hypothetical protein
MTWIVEAEADRAGTQRGYVLLSKPDPRRTQILPTPEAIDEPIFGPLPIGQASRLALLLNDLMQRREREAPRGTPEDP